MTTLNKSWCPIPWNNCSIKNNGDYRVCVYANSDRKSRGLLGYGMPAEENPSKYNAVYSGPNDVRNADILKRVRFNMLNGIKDEMCVRCNVEDAHDIPSARKWAVNEFKNTITLDKCKEKTNYDGSINPKDFDISLIDLRFGNVCNLKCRSCWPGESSAWSEDWEALGEPSPGDSYNWYSDEAVDRIVDSIGNIKQIHISGGEPLYLKQHTTFLEKLIDRGMNKKITLDYNSNLTKLPPRIIELWKQFKQVRVGVSVDGYNGVNDYIRYPSKWKDVIVNFDKLRQLDNCKSWFTTTVMIHNIIYLPDLFEYVLNNYPTSKLNTIINLHLLRNPAHLNIQTLPLAVKQKVAAKLDRWLVSEFVAKQPDQVRLELTNHIDGFVEFMLDDFNYTFKKFVTVTETLDKLRNQNFRNDLSELYDMMQDEYEEAARTAIIK